MEERMWVFFVPPVVAGLGMLLLVRVVKRTATPTASDPRGFVPDSNTHQYWPPDASLPSDAKDHCPPAGADNAPDYVPENVPDTGNACDTGGGFDSGGDCGGGDSGGGDGGGGCD